MDAFPCNLQDITIDKIKKYKADRRKDVSPATVNRELSLLSHIFTINIEDGKIHYDPTKKVKRFKEKPRIRFLERDEIDRLLAHAVDYQRPIIQTALHTAFRVSDILALTWGQIDFARRTITLTQIKTDGPILQPMTEELIKVLTTVPRHVSSPYIFHDADGKPYKRIVKGFTAACKRAGIKDFHFHDLRHTFASHYLMQGGDLKTLQVLMGHKTIAMTAKYAHLAQRHLHQEIKRIDNLFGGNDDINANRANGQ